VQALLDSLHETHDHLARASESEDELDPLGCMRKLLLQVFNELVLDARTRRINEILHHKCEFTDDMCEIRQQRQSAVLIATRASPWRWPTPCAGAIAWRAGCRARGGGHVCLCRWPDRALAAAA
jgi:hypothetical protein